MALLEMAANVHCNGYFPGYYSTRDPIFGVRDSTWTSSNGNNELKSDHYHNGSLPVSSSVHLSGYNKELLKQTILKHEAIFRDQIHELHRLYQKQRELMDEIKRDALYRHNLRLETSQSSFFLSHVSSKNAEKISLPNLPRSTGKSSDLIAESIQLPVRSLQEKGRQVIPAPSATPIKGYLKDSTLSESKYRKVGKKILDLELPADEYIDSGEDEFLKVPAYTLDGISQVLCNTDGKPDGGNTNTFADLNEPFKFKEKEASKSGDLVGPTHPRNMLFQYPSRRSNNVIQIQEKDLTGCSYDPPSVKNHQKLSSINIAGQSAGVLDSLAKVIYTEKLSVSSDSVGKKLEQVNDQSCFLSLDQINQGPQSERKFAIGGSSAGTQIPTSDGLLGLSSASSMYTPYQPFSEAPMRSSGISPVVSREIPLSDLGQSPVSVQSLSCLSTYAHSGQSSKAMLGMPGLAGDKFYKCKSISGPNLDGQSFFLSSLCSGSKPSDLPPISINDLKSCDDHGSSVGHKLKMYVKGSEDVGPPKYINLNIMPADYSATTSCDIIQITDNENKFQDLRRGLPWLKEKPVPKENHTEESKSSTHMESVLLEPYNSGGIHGFELKKLEEGDLNARILAFHINGKPHPFSDLLSSHASPSKVCQNQSESHKIEEIEKNCGSDVFLPIDNVPDIGEQVHVGEHCMKNEMKQENKGLAGIIDLNSCMNEDENMPMDIDLQAPVSPENKECSPPRGESDENQLEMPYQLAGNKDPETQEEHVRIAAEALVSISAFVANSGFQMITCPPSDSFPSGPLHWFARIVSLITDHSEGEVKVDFSCNTDDLEELLPSGIDYFEAMTLKLTETKVLDCCCKSINQNEEEGGCTSPTQRRKGWTKRGRQRKDFQSDILPSLASLSRYEVTEDLQTIGSLMEAAGTLLETGSLRSAGRNALARGRRRSIATASNNTDMLMKQLTGNAELGIEKSGLVSWAKVSRKRRAQRYPAKSRHFVSSQVNN